MHEYIIQGGFPVNGTIKASGNKNAALPCIAAAILSEEPIILKNIPEIEDVFVMLQVFEALGGHYEKIEKNVFKLQIEKVKTSKIPEDLATKIRASILFAGPLLARTGKAVLPPPGGDVIGRRRLDTHFLALTELGARVETDQNFSFSGGKLTSV